jgi:hypothetical protein
VAGFEFQQVRAPRITGEFTWTGGTRPQLTARAASDTVTVGDWSFAGNGGTLSGYTDSLGWSAGTSAGQGARVDGAGRWQRRDSTQLVWFDSLRAALPALTYRLLQPAILSLGGAAPSVSPLNLQALDGSGLVRVAGTIPSEAPGAMALEVVGLDVSDLYGLLQRDTTGVNGELGMSLEIGGTTRSPTFRGTARLGEGRFGDFQSPFVQGVLNYADRRLDANLNLWRTGENILAIEAHLPLDLGITGVEQRRVDGPLRVLTARW